MEMTWPLWLLHFFVCHAWDRFDRIGNSTQNARGWWMEWGCNFFFICLCLGLSPSNNDVFFSSAMSSTCIICSRHWRLCRALAQDSVCYASTLLESYEFVRIECSRSLAWRKRSAGVFEYHPGLLLKVAWITIVFCSKFLNIVQQFGQSVLIFAEEWAPGSTSWESYKSVAQRSLYFASIPLYLSLDIVRHTIILLESFWIMQICCSIVLVLCEYSAPRVRVFSSERDLQCRSFRRWRISVFQPALLRLVAISQSILPCTNVHIVGLLSLLASMLHLHRIPVWAAKSLWPTLIKFQFYWELETFIEQRLSSSLWLPLRLKLFAAPRASSDLVGLLGKG